MRKRREKAAWRLGALALALVLSFASFAQAADVNLVGDSTNHAITGDHNYNAGTLSFPTNAGAPTGANDAGDVVLDTTNDHLYVGQGSSSWTRVYGYRGFHVHMNGTDDTGLAADVWNAPDWQTEDRDTDGDFNLANDRFEPQIAGKWRLTATIRWATLLADATYYGIALYKNGSFYLLGEQIQNGGSGWYPALHMSADVAASDGDYFELRVYATAGPYAIKGTNTYTYFQGSYQGP